MAPSEVLILMKVRKYTPEDYALVADWWSKRDWPPVPEDVLGKNGFIAEDDDSAYCAVWIYHTDTKLHLLEWYVSDPDTDQNKRDLAMDTMIAHAVCYIKEVLGGKYVFSSVTHDGLIDRLNKRHKFAITERNMTNMVHAIGS